MDGSHFLDFLMSSGQPALPLCWQSREQIRVIEPDLCWDEYLSLLNPDKFNFCWPRSFTLMVSPVPQTQSFSLAGVVRSEALAPVIDRRRSSVVTSVCVSKSSPGGDASGRASLYSAPPFSPRCGGAVKHFIRRQS